jgi:hypothetical protein
MYICTASVLKPPLSELLFALQVDVADHFNQFRKDYAVMKCIQNRCFHLGSLIKLFFNVF